MLKSILFATELMIQFVSFITYFLSDVFFVATAMKSMHCAKRSWIEFALPEIQQLLQWKVPYNSCYHEEVAIIVSSLTWHVTGKEAKQHLCAWRATYDTWERQVLRHGREREACAPSLETLTVQLQMFPIHSLSSTCWPCQPLSSIIIVLHFEFL